MKKTLRLLVLTSAFALAGAAWGTEVAGVKVEEKSTAAGRELVLNGAGLRTRLFFKVYVAALYVPRKSSTAAVVLESSEPARISLRLMRDLDADTLYGAMRDGLAPNLQEGEMATMQVFLDALAGLMRRIGNIRSGDTVTLDFLPDGLTVSLNGESKGTIPGGKNARRLLTIWLGDRPVEEGLKKALLGN
ncbi:chalcone isomerase family protein [Denitratisoma sp. agr-D3]